MIKSKLTLTLSLVAALAVGLSIASAAPKKGKAQKGKAQLEIQLSETGKSLEAKYAATLAELKAEITRALPNVSEQKKAALQAAYQALNASAEKSDDAAGPQQELGKAEGLVKHGHWWTGDAKKKIAKAQADLKSATTDAARQAAQKTIEEQQKRYEAGMAELKKREAVLEQAKVRAAAGKSASEAAKAALAQAHANEIAAAKALLADLDPFLASDKLDAKLVKCTVLTEATPRGLAAFAQQGPAQAALVDKLLADDKLMKEMLVAGGAPYGKYGQAMEIYTAILKASPKANEGMFHRLALATSLEHAVPIKQKNAEAQTDAPATVDPVKRYLHYEKAYLAGDLDPAFKGLTTWEYRMVVDCDAPDEILAWGRQMLQNYRPDHITNPNYGWRYSAAVKTEVPYGSQNVGKDLPTLNNYQNIPKDGGVCGRRAFFGRFILRSFGIPVWGVTQHAHAALSHWTPKGWVVNLGAGFNSSWWDKDEFSLSGADFLVESQAREREQDYLKVLRARWVSRILGEEAYNGRRNVEGGFWSRAALYESRILASSAVELGPLGQELAEANEAEDKDKSDATAVGTADQKIVVGRTGAVTIPALAYSGKATGKVLALKSHGGGMQLNCSGGFKAQYAFEVPQAGKYALTARVATLQEGQKFLFAANNAKDVEVAVPYTVGMWQATPSVEVNLVSGRNVLNFAVQDGSRGVAIKEFTLTPVK